MNAELEQVNGNQEENVQSGIIGHDNGYQNGKLDAPFECKLEVLSECEDEQECVAKQDNKGNYLGGVDVKEENVDPKGTTEDESMAVEALRQLGGMFENVPAPNPQPAPFRQHICNICGDSFERKTDLGNHIVCHQVDRPHACRICGNLFRRKADLQNHMVCHQIERPHRCPQCGADFQRPSSLTNHMKIHTYSPGRALLSSSSPVTHQAQTLANYQGFPPTTTAQQPNQPVTDKVSAVQIESYNGWNVNYSYGRDSVNVDNGNMLPHNQAIETSVTLGNHEQNYQSMTPKPYVQVTGISENISQFDYGGSSGPIIESVESLQGQQCGNSDLSTPVRGAQSQLDCSIGNFGNVTQVDHLPKGTNLNFNSEGYGDAAVKVETMSFMNSMKSASTEGTYSCQPTSEQPKEPTDNSRRPHVCRHCGLGFARGKALESHERLHQDHWGSPVECDKCEEMFPENISLRQHQETCLGKVAGPSRQMEQHHQQIGGFTNANSCAVNSSSNPAQPAKIGKHACTECDKRFTTKQKLFRHMWIHRKRPHVCEVCGVSLADREALDEHRRTQHPGDTPFTCIECGKSFASRQGLWEHGRMHTRRGRHGGAPYLCQRCGKCFASRQGHLIHNRTHTGERPYGCRFCWKAFRDGGTLRKHERIHTGERPHVCPLCPRAFNQKVVLREHVRWVHAARNSDSCQLCGYLVGDREALCAHIVKHSDQLAAAAKAAKGKQEAPKATGPQDIPNSVIPVEQPVVLPQEPYNAASYAFLPADALTCESPDSNMNNKIMPEVKNEYSCDMCGEMFKLRTELLNHVRIHI